MLTTEDVQAIHQLISLYGHVVDDRQYARLAEVLTEDSRLDLSNFNAGIIEGCDAIIRHWLETDLKFLPLAHNFSDILISEDADGTVRVTNKGLSLYPEGRITGALYRNVVRKGSFGWRMAERVIIARG